jgi:anti-sigma B factor antagonist
MAHATAAGRSARRCRRTGLRPAERGGLRPSSTMAQMPRYGVPMRGSQEHRFQHTIGRVLLLWLLTVRGVRVEGLGLSSRRHGEVVVVAISGELDAVTSREFDEYLTTARQQSDRVILDLSAVDFMDTSSLAVIVGHWKKLTARDGTLALAGARYRYTKTLWITGLADRLPRYDTLEQAIAALADGSADG